MNPLNIHRVSKFFADKIPTIIILGFIVVILAGSILGAFIGYKTSGLITACGGLILGGTAGLFVGLNVFCGVEAALAEVLRVFTRKRK